MWHPIVCDTSCVLTCRSHGDCLTCVSAGTGDGAKITRVMNDTLTPVTHELLPRPAASGQMTCKQIQQLRIDQGLLPKRHFFLFGHPVRNSPSRVLHSTGFRVLHLPHTCVAVMA